MTKLSNTKNAQWVAIEERIDTHFDFLAGLLGDDGVPDLKEDLRLYLNRNPKFLAGEPRGIVDSAIEIHRLDLSLSDNSLPCNLSIDHKNKVTYMIGYKALMSCVLRSPEVAYIDADLVAPTDDFVFDRITGIESHSWDHRSQRDVKSYTTAYAYIQYRDGRRQSKIMQRNEIDELRQTVMSKMGDRAKYSAWATHGTEMAKKTCVLRLLKFANVPKEIISAAANEEYSDAVPHEEAQDVPEAPKEQAQEAAPATAAAPKRRGRPKKVEAQPPAEKPTEEGDASESLFAPPEPPKKRGRPRKPVITSAAKAAPEEDKTDATMGDIAADTEGDSVEEFDEDID